jgi:hypothetical protein
MAVPVLPPLSVANLPLVLAGPIVRRVDTTSVTVWLALKAPRKVTLDVYEGATGSLPPEAPVTGTGVTARIGDNLHIVAVTARARSGRDLRPGTIHRYNLRFGEDASAPAGPVPAGAPDLFSKNVVAWTEDDAKQALTYPDAPGAPTLPSFVTPPADPGGLRLFHASCRKPHGEGTDALTILDEVLADDVGSATDRPQQLILTGDQIYADDVADGMLYICTAYGHTLLGRGERFPTLPEESRKRRLFPGRRQELVDEDFGLTTTHGRSHLLRLSEFLAMYLMVWSPVLWPALPTMGYFADLYPKEAAALGNPHVSEYRALLHKPRDKEAGARLGDYITESDRLDEFRATLPKVRRALANTATYMIFDDHEVTDDWFISAAWVNDVCGTVHGRQFLGNGLAAYAVCQGWGNTPEQFAEGPLGEAGRDLLAALAAPDHTAPGPAAVIARRTGVPSGTDPAGRITRADGSLAWHYSITWPGHQMVVLDTRTQRVFREGAQDPPALLYSDASYTAMVEGPRDQGPEKVTLLVSPCPVLGYPLVEDFIQPTARALAFDTYANQLENDYEAWAHDPLAFEKFVSRVLGHADPGPDGVRRRRVVSIGGDVHYAFAIRMAYHATVPYRGRPGEVRGVMAQLTASSLKNETGGTVLLHRLGYGPDRSSAEVPSTRRAGWANADGEGVAVRIAGLDGAHSSVVREVPAVYELPPRSTLRSPAPEWEYRLDYYRHNDPDGKAPRPGKPAPVSYPAWGDRRAALAQYVQAAGNHDGYMNLWGSGREVVGRNNIGEIQFSWGAGDAKSVIQTLWWHLPGPGSGAPLTRLVVPLDVGPATELAPEAPSGPDTEGLPE